MISRLRIEQCRLTRVVTKRAFGGETSATGRAMDDLLAAIDEREQALAELINHGAHGADLDHACDLLRGGKYEVKP